ncbi:MAG: hypothetical protein APU95_00485 [Hadesarchaea archaeon YNP_N21]|jgi:Predicted RNA-binding protein (contains PUA domain)|nr:MAG: hypothetical protein APU95_00485 [Hadesarchaea archaeon YNP_N21]
MRRFQLRKNQIKQLISELGAKLSIPPEMREAKSVEVIRLGNDREMINFENKFFLIKSPQWIVPIVSLADLFNLKRVIVDMGAVPHVVNGADVMSPGIVRADEGIKEGDIVAVADERHGKVIAIGLALVGGEAMKAPKGKAVKNLHYVGDDVWRQWRERLSQPKG